MEQWDIYDKDGKLTGRTKTRNDIFNFGEYHLGVSLWIVNHKRELLIQKRAKSKRIHPNIWATTCGAVISGETSRQGCIRETKEEIGININENDLVLLSRSFVEDSIFDDYITVQDFEIQNTVVQPDEVSELKWATIDEVKRLFSLGLFMADDIDEIEKVIRHIEKPMK